MIDPLHQFMVTPLIPLQLFGIDLTFTTSSLFMVLAVLVTLLVFHLGSREQQDAIPSKIGVVTEKVHTFIQDLIKAQVGDDGLKYTPYILSIFMFILMGNLLGLIPFSFTFTSQLVVTIGLALFVFISVTFIGVYLHGFHFFRLFCPKGTPLYIAPLLVPVEIMSYLSRPVSLGVRLFANMVAGHAMLKIFASFCVLLAGGMLLPLAILPFVMTVAITAFEVLVAVLQAYVFTILTCIYLNDAINLH